MINFTEVEHSVRELKKQLSAGQISEKAFEDCLLGMIDVAQDGYYWMFGHESEKWFRHDGEKWIPDDPGRFMTTSPAAETPLAPHSPIEQGSELAEDSINWDWLVASIVVIIAIGWIVYSSSLVLP